MGNIVNYLLNWMIFKINLAHRIMRILRILRISNSHWVRKKRIWETVVIEERESHILNILNILIPTPIDDLP